MTSLDVRQVRYPIVYIISNRKICNIDIYFRTDRLTDVLISIATNRDKKALIFKFLKFIKMFKFINFI